MFVDEYQDVDEQQYLMLRQLAAPGARICAIGDPDQAIYGFRGGDVGYFLRFHGGLRRRGRLGSRDRGHHGAAVAQLPVRADDRAGRDAADPAGHAGAWA